MPQRHMWLHRLLFFLDRTDKDEKPQQQQQREAKTPVLTGAGLQLPPTALKHGLVQPKVLNILISQTHIGTKAQLTCSLKLPEMPNILGSLLFASK